MTEGEANWLEAGSLLSWVVEVENPLNAEFEERQ